MRNKGRRVFLLFFFLLSFDQAIKFFTFRHIPLMNWSHVSYPYGGIGIFQDVGGVSFSLNQVQNLGAAWGLFAEYSKQLFWLRALFVCLLFLYWFFSSQPLFKKRAFFLILVGASGNVMDFFLYGHVIDMFHFNLWGYTFPVFNLADSFICIGVAFLFFASFQKKMKKQKAL